MNNYQSYLFGILLCAAIFGLYLSHRVYKALESRHPEKFKMMGKPSLLMNNSVANNLLFTRYLFKREWRELDDPALSKLSALVLVYFVMYIFGFGYLILGIFSGFAP